MTDSGALIEKIPRLFHLLSAATDHLHAGLGLTAGMRGVLVSLDKAAKSVPKLAAERPVSRQYMQQVVDALVETGRLESRPNPRHRRSSLYALTAAGAEDLSRIRTSELAALRQLGDAISPVRAAGALSVLLDLESALVAALPTSVEGTGNDV